MKELQWRTSSYSNGGGGSCVQLAEAETGVAMRNSNRIGDGMIVLERAQVAELVAAINAGKFDHLT